MSDGRGIAVFETTHAALAAEKACRKARIPVRMAPVPRHISSACNMGMIVPNEHLRDAKDAVAGAGVACRFVAL